MSAPMNFKIANPTSSANWCRTQEKQRWIELNREADGNSDFYPLTIKGAYIMGIIYAICESVEHLLQHPHCREVTYISAYGVFASGVEILGRCIRGNQRTRGSTKDLKAGYKWLAVSPSPHIRDWKLIPDDHTLIRTQHGNYTIENLIHLRHFAAHGQATANIHLIDFEILSSALSMFAQGLSHYWNKLKDNEDLCNNLAKANIIPFRNGPITKIWRLLEWDRSAHKYHSINEIFNRFNWGCV